jgi:hypothetical protein
MRRPAGEAGGQPARDELGAAEIEQRRATDFKQQRRRCVRAGCENGDRPKPIAVGRRRRGQSVGSLSRAFSGFSRTQSAVSSYFAAM